MTREKTGTALKDCCWVSPRYGTVSDKLCPLFILILSMELTLPFQVLDKGRFNIECVYSRNHDIASLLTKVQELQDEFHPRRRSGISSCV